MHNFHVHVHDLCGGQSTVWGSLLSPSTVWDLGLKLKSSGLAAEPFPAEPSRQPHTVNLRSLSNDCVTAWVFTVLKFPPPTNLVHYFWILKHFFLESRQLIQPDSFPKCNVNASVQFTVECPPLWDLSEPRFCCPHFFWHSGLNTHQNSPLCSPYKILGLY